MKMKFDSIVKSFLKENEHNKSIRVLLYQLLGDLGPEAKTKNGDLVSVRLQGIVDEFDEITKNAKENSKQPETHELLRKIASFD